MKTKGHRDYHRCPRKIRRDAAWLQQHMPAMEGHVMCEKCRTALNARLKAARDAYRQREAKT